MKALLLTLALAAPASAGVYSNVETSTSTGKMTQDISGQLRVAKDSTTYSLYWVQVIGSSGVVVGTGTAQILISTGGYAQFPGLSAPGCTANSQGLVYRDYASGALKLCMGSSGYVYLATSSVAGVPTNLAVLDGNQTFTGINTFTGSSVTISGPYGLRVIGAGQPSFSSAGLYVRNPALSYGLVISSPSGLGQLVVDALGHVLVGTVGYNYADELLQVTGGAVVTGSFTGISSATIGGELGVLGVIKAGSGQVQLTTAGGKIQAISSTYFNSLDGSALTSLTAANISAGSLGSSVIASSIAVGAVHPAALVASSTYSITLAATGVNDGSLSSRVVASSIAVGAVHPATMVANSTYSIMVPAANINDGALSSRVVASSITLPTLNPVWPNLIDIDPMSGASANTNWSGFNDSLGSFYYGTEKLSNGTQNDSIEFDVLIGTGTWDLTFIYNKGNNRGIFTVTLGGASFGTQDAYNASSANNNKATMTGLVVTTPGAKRLKFQMATKNASSSNYYGGLQHIQLRRAS